MKERERVRRERESSEVLCEYRQISGAERKRYTCREKRKKERERERASERERERKRRERNDPCFFSTHVRTHLLENPGVHHLGHLLVEFIHLRRVHVSRHVAS